VSHLGHGCPVEPSNGGTWILWWQRPAIEKLRHEFLMSERGHAPLSLFKFLTHRIVKIAKLLFHTSKFWGAWLTAVKTGASQYFPNLSL
jgi:hypothetical protein